MRISEHNLPKLLFTGMLVIVISLSLALGLYYTAQAIKQTEALITLTKEDVRQQQKSILQNEIDSIRDYAKHVRGRTEDVLKADIKEQTDQAYQLAEAIWLREKDKRPEHEIKKLIVEALRPIRFFNGRGYYFIDDQEGRCILLPIAPKLENTSLLNNQDDTGQFIMRNLLDAANNPEGSGFARYRWYAPDSPREMREKIAYVRQFKPYRWIIGTGEYVHTVEDDLRRQVLERIKARRFGKDGYISVIKLLPNHDVEIVANPTSPNVGKKRSELRPDTIEYQLLGLITDSALKGGGLLEYEWKHPTQDAFMRKVSQVSLIPEWNWVLIAGIYYEDLDKLISEKEQEASELRNRNLLGSLLIAGIATLVALIFASLYSRWVAGLFSEFAKEKKLSASVFESSQEAIFITDPQGHIIKANAAFEKITGYSAAEVIGKTPKFLSSGEHDAEFYQRMRDALEANGMWAGEIWNRHRNGSIYPEWQLISAVKDEQGRLTNYISTFTDISEQKRTEKQLRQLADYDILTNLPNRRLLIDRASYQLAHQERVHGHAAVMFLDLDHFKHINDSLGHAAGDRLLLTVANRLRSCIRAEDTVSRIGGDEFVVMLSEIEHPDDAARVAHKLNKQLAVPINLGEQQVEITSSIGIAVYPEDGSDIENLLKNADAAMYHAKAQGRNNFQFFTAELNERAEARVILEAALRQALKQNELRLHYQPQISLRTGLIVGCEALVRWQHPEKGLIYPLDFIPLAEETGLIEAIGQWVLDEAVRQCAIWHVAGLPLRRMSINISPVQLRQAEFDEAVRQTLARHELPAEFIELEITESMLVDRSKTLLDTLHRLQDIGIQFALDDFGTGYSNLSYLKKFQMNRLKIDRSFVSDIPHDALDATLTTAIIGLADNFGLGVIAEGVETAEQLEFLQTLGCDEVQGYYFYKPMPPEAMSELLSQQRSTN